MSDNTYYFVRHKTIAPDTTPIEGQAILKNVHPVTWAAHPPEMWKRLKMFTQLVFWEQIPEDVALDAVKANWIGMQE